MPSYLSMGGSYNPFISSEAENYILSPFETFQNLICMVNINE